MTKAELVVSMNSFFFVASFVLCESGCSEVQSDRTANSGTNEINSHLQLETNQASTSPLPAPSASPTIDRCCACIYDDAHGNASACASQTSATSCADAGKYTWGGVSYSDCQWNSTTNSCSHRYGNQCTDFCAAATKPNEQGKKSCSSCEIAAKSTVVLGSGGIDTTALSLNNCPAVIEHRGHSWTGQCGTAAAIASTCIKNSCPTVSINWDGCMTGNNSDLVLKKVSDLQAQLSGSQKVCISMNQLISTSECQTRIDYEITCDSICATPGPCQATGATCFASNDGDIAMCTASGKETVQSCCCDTDITGKKSNCKFKAPGTFCGF